MKNSNDAIGNRTRNFPACSTVPHSTAPLRAPYVKIIGYKIKVSHSAIYFKFMFTSLLYNQHADASIFLLKPPPISFMFRVSKIHFIIVKKKLTTKEPSC
jgi:hypothetical protein